MGCHASTSRFRRPRAQPDTPASTSMRRPSARVLAKHVSSGNTPGQTPDTTPHHHEGEEKETDSSPVHHVQDDDPFAPPPPLPSSLSKQPPTGRSDSTIAVHVESIGSSNNNVDAADEEEEEEEDALDTHGSPLRRPENHFDPIPMPDIAVPEVDSGRRSEVSLYPTANVDITHPQERNTSTFRTDLAEHDKTDASQAALEYQQRMEAKRQEAEVHTKRRRLEEFDPVRPIDSFNVTHRCLLGRCWDRRTPELIPVSFVHALAKVIGAEESHPASTTTASHFSGGDEFPPPSPVQHPSRFSRRSGAGGATVGGSAAVQSWTGIGGQRVPRRSHWFSVGGVSVEGPLLNQQQASARASPTTGSVPYFSSGVSSPTGPRPGPGSQRPFPRSATGAAKPTAADTEEDRLIHSLKMEEILALSSDRQERYFNLHITRNPRYLGIKDTFAYKLSSGISSDRSVRFLRKRNLEPAPGVTAVRWNRVEFLHPSLHTLVRAVAKTQGRTLAMAEVERASDLAAISRFIADGSATANAQGVSSGGVSASTGRPSGTAAVVTDDSDAFNDATAMLASVADDDHDADASGPMLMNRSFSQFVMGHVENRSFARNSGSAGWRDNGGVGVQNASIVGPAAATTSLAETHPLRTNNSVSAAKDDEAALANTMTSSLGNPAWHYAKNMGSDDEQTLTASHPFPEDSVLALALGMPYSRLSRLTNSPLAAQAAALLMNGRSGNVPSYGLGARRTSKDVLGAAGSGPSSPRRGSSASPPRGTPTAGGVPPLPIASSTAIISLSVSCFSVAIDPFEWKERQYTRYPIDIDRSKRSARCSFGEGVVTEVMYGGLLVVECTSQEAVEALQDILTSMTWTEGRSLLGIIRDVQKRHRHLRSNIQKARRGTGTGATVSSSTSAWDSHSYRILRRIGGRPMRDAVELQDISVFFDADAAQCERVTTLHQPAEAQLGATSKKFSSPATQSVASQESASEARGFTSTAASASAADPDTTSSFSRVASAWMGLPVISAVLRSWALHLLTCPEYAQPTAMFLQRHAGLAPVLQISALGSLYHQGDTPSEDDAVPDEVDLLFEAPSAEAVRPAEDKCAPTSLSTDHHYHHHHRPAKRIPKYNRFYASLPASSNSESDGDGEAQQPQQRSDSRSKVDGRGRGRGGMLTAANSHSDLPASQDQLDVVHEKMMVESGSGEDADWMEGCNTEDGAAVDGEAQRRQRRESRSGSLPRKNESTETMIGVSIDGPSAPHSFFDEAAVLAAPAATTDAPAEGKMKAKPKSYPGGGSGVAAAKRRPSGKPQKSDDAAVRPGSRCDSPISPGGVTVPQTGRNEETGGKSPAISSRSGSSDTLSPSSSSSFFQSSPQVRRETTVVYNTENHGTALLHSTDQGSNIADAISSCASAIMMVNGDVDVSGSRLTRVTAPAGAHHSGSIVMDMPVAKGGQISEPPDASATAAPSTVYSDTSFISPEPSLELFMPASGVPTHRAASLSPGDQLVAMAATVGPEDSLAYEVARRGKEAHAMLPCSPPSRTPRRGSVTRKGSAGGGSATSIDDGVTSDGKRRSVVVVVPQPRSCGGEELDQGKRDAMSAAEEVRCRTFTQSTLTLTADMDEPSKESNAMVVLRNWPNGMTQPNTPLGGATAAYDHLPAPARIPALSTTRTAIPTAAHHRTEEEAEGIWYMTMLEVKAQQQELEDLRQARMEAEDRRQQRQDELRALNRIFLPHTSPQDLDCTLLYLKTALYEAEDLPNRRLFLQHLDWMPLLTAVWTSPANRCPSVEVAAELTWQDIPRLGCLAGLLYHHNAAGPLEELVLHAEKLLGAPQPLSGPEDEEIEAGWDAALNGRKQNKRRWGKSRKEKHSDPLEDSHASLNFVTQLDCTVNTFGLGCPPFFIAPEEARDTLWLLLCAVATNTATGNFRVVLRGMPARSTSTAAGTGGGGIVTSSGAVGGATEYEKQRTPSSFFTSLFGARRREEAEGEPLLLKPSSMLLDSFVVQATSPLSEAGSEYSPYRLAMPSPSSTSRSSPTGGDLMLNDTLGDAIFLPYTMGGSLLIENSSNGQAIGSPPPPPLHGRHHRIASRQSSSLFFITSTQMGTEGGSEVVTGSFTITPPLKRTLSSLLPQRGANRRGRSSSPPPRHAVSVLTHRHHVKRRPWVHEGGEVEERPFYEVLMHHCSIIAEARAAAEAADNPMLLTSVFVEHYHHPYNQTHNDPRFFIPPKRQARLQQAVQRAVDVVNGEVTPMERSISDTVYTSHSAAAISAKPEQPSLGGDALPGLGGPAPSPPPPAVLCPPPLVFHATNWLFGLQSAEEEMRVLHYEETRLRARAEDIWEALRKAVKHYNRAQQEARQKALKSSSKLISGTASSVVLPPLRLITLEH